MRLDHNHATHLESVVRSILKCDRYAYGGLVNADLYESHPLEAAILIVSRLFDTNRDNDNEYCGDIAIFLDKWRCYFDNPDEHNHLTVKMYIEELEEMAKYIIAK